MGEFDEMLDQIAGYANDAGLSLERNLIVHCLKKVGITYDEASSLLSLCGHYVKATEDTEVRKRVFKADVEAILDRADYKLEKEIYVCRQIIALSAQLDETHTLDNFLAEIHFKLGEALHQTGELDEATISFQNAITLDRSHVGAFMNLGLCLEMEGKLDEAIPAFRHTVYLEPHIADNHYHLGTALVQKGELCSNCCPTQGFGDQPQMDRSPKNARARAQETA